MWNVGIKVKWLDFLLIWCIPHLTLGRPILQSPFWAHYTCRLYACLPCVNTWYVRASNLNDKKEIAQCLLFPTQHTIAHIIALPCIAVCFNACVSKVRWDALDKKCHRNTLTCVNTHIPTMHHTRIMWMGPETSFISRLLCVTFNSDISTTAADARIITRLFCLFFIAKQVYFYCHTIFENINILSTWKVRI